APTATAIARGSHRMRGTAAVTGWTVVVAIAASSLSPWAPLVQRNLWLGNVARTLVSAASRLVSTLFGSARRPGHREGFSICRAGALRFGVIYRVRVDPARKASTRVSRLQTRVRATSSSMQIPPAVADDHLPGNQLRIVAGEKRDE